MIGREQDSIMKWKDWREQLLLLQQLLEQHDFSYQKKFINLLDAIAGKYADTLTAIREKDHTAARNTESLHIGLEQITKLISECRHPLTGSEGSQDFGRAVDILRSDVNELMGLIDHSNP
jgi:hypothetical protein